MEIILMALGLVMYYAWIHSVVVLCKKIKGLTPYEEVLLPLSFGPLSFGLFILYLMGTL